LELHRFMHKYHEMGELAPRDVVARAIAHELEVTKRPDAVVYLDLTHLKSETVRKRFPTIYATCMRYNVDITEELVPIRPAAHYAMGGVRTDLDGRSSIPGLYAAGEVACTGVHGANRLASNSLLEGLVYGARAARAMRNEMRSSQALAGPAIKPIVQGDGNTGETEKIIQKVQSKMWQHVAVVRDGKVLKQVVADLTDMVQQLPKSGGRRSYETANILQTGLLIARSALAREESRGAHYRLDFPLKNDKKFAKHSVVRSDTISFE
jgi:L-aspartate oxidase